MRGDIWNVDLGKPYGSEQGGIRPCVVLQNDIGNEFSPITIIVPLTSSSKNYMATHVPIKLDRQSYVLCEQIRVVDKNRIKNKVGRINDRDLKEVERVVKSQIGLGD